MAYIGEWEHPTMPLGVIADWRRGVWASTRPKPWHVVWDEIQREAHLAPWRRGVWR